MNTFPDWLSAPAQKKFLEMLKQIPDNEQSKAILAMLTDCYGDYVKCVDHIKENGLIINNQQNPSVKLKIELGKTICGLFKQLKLKNKNAVLELGEKYNA